MKNVMYLMLVILITAGVTYVVIARPAEQGMMGGGMGGGGMMGGRGMMDSNNMMMQRRMGQGGMMGQRGMMGQGGMMGGGMMCNSSLAATSDGGVVLMAGNKLSKYDKDLNLVKEVEVKIDWEKWGNMMEQHRNMMMKHGMMGQGGMMGGGMMYDGSLAATSDGGIVVMIGNKLSKYDKDLNLVKEVEVKIDWENWGNMMEQHRNMMMKHGMTGSMGNR